jgi:UPF0755 protein
VKKILVVLLLLLLLAGISVFAGYFWYQQQLTPPSNSQEAVTLLVKRGTAASGIARQLKEAGVIKSEMAFRVYLRLNSLENSLPPGEFLLPKNLSVAQLVVFMQKGPEEYWVTIPEGLRREQLPDRFIKSLGLTGQKADTFRSDFMAASEGKEGYLYPDTYLIPATFDGTRSAQLMLSTFDKKFSDLFENESQKKRAVIIASIIERETRNNEEKPIVAGVFENRMRDGMPLQADATVQYALANLSCVRAGVVNFSCPDWWPTVYLDDYKLVHPYSTYSNPGLPPSPIASPGEASIKAALSPESTNYFYYIHDTKGRVYFAETLTEHNRNIENYLR